MQSAATAKQGHQVRCLQFACVVVFRHWHAFWRQWKGELDKGVPTAGCLCMLQVRAAADAPSHTQQNSCGGEPSRELIEILKARGLSGCRGKKEELIQRILDAQERAKRAVQT